MAVYTALSKEEIELLLLGYDIGSLISYNPIESGVENSNFLIVTQKNKYILTILEDRVNKNNVDFYVKLKLHLHNKGFSCPLPIFNKNQDVVGSIHNKPFVIISFLNGHPVHNPGEQDVYIAGMYLAKMHMCLGNFNLLEPNNFSLSKWKWLYEQIKDKKIDSHLKDIFYNELCFLEKEYANMPTLPKGTIHADYFPENVFFDNGNISGVIDFYFACFDYLVFDLAIAITSWCFSKENKLELGKLNKMIEGYESFRKLTMDEKRYLPIFLRSAAVRFLSTRTYDALYIKTNALVKIKDPFEYLNKLKTYQAL